MNGVGETRRREGWGLLQHPLELPIRACAGLHHVFHTSLCMLTRILTFSRTNRIKNRPYSAAHRWVSNSQCGLERYLPHVARMTWPTWVQGQGKHPVSSDFIGRVMVERSERITGILTCHNFQRARLLAVNFNSRLSALYRKV